jgi:hypothetical protein
VKLRGRSIAAALGPLTAFSGPSSTSSCDIVSTKLHNSSFYNDSSHNNRHNVPFHKGSGYAAYTHHVHEADGAAVYAADGAHDEASAGM